MKYFLCIILVLVCFKSYAEENWHEFWQKGRDYYHQGLYLHASSEFDQAIKLMSENELEKHPYVLVDRAENNYFVENAPNVMNDTARALESKNLTESEKLICGLTRVSMFMKMEDLDSAMEEYKKYIIDCPLFPKYDFLKNKIVIRNIPDCNCYKNLMKEFLLSQFCEKEDLYEDHNMWIVSISKNCCCMEKDFDINSDYAEPTLGSNTRRGPEQIRACCNTCSTLATGAQFICGCLPMTNPATLTCKAACVMFVEGLRQACEWCCYNGGIQEKCWKNFATWKDDFKEKNSDCPAPPASCP